MRGTLSLNHQTQKLTFGARSFVVPRLRRLLRHGRDTSRLTEKRESIGKSVGTSQGCLRASGAITRSNQSSSGLWFRSSWERFVKWKTHRRQLRLIAWLCPCARCAASRQRWQSEIPIAKSCITGRTNSRLADSFIGGAICMIRARKSFHSGKHCEA